MPAGYNNVACLTAEATTVGYNPNVFDLWRRSGGRLDLSEGAFRRWDEAPDEEFYQVPRFVTHIDDGAISAVTQLYREYFPAGGAILDLMSSWISHLPPEVSYRRVAGLGMNEAELAANPRLDERVVQNLNTDPRLPFAAGEFDGVAICVSIDYLTDAVTVLREAGRVSTEGAPTAISFSNRCFPTKAVAIWHRLDEAGRVRLVQSYLAEAGVFSDIQCLYRSPGGPFRDPLYAVIGRATNSASRADA